MFPSSTIVTDVDALFDGVLFPLGLNATFSSGISFHSTFTGSLVTVLVEVP